MIFLIVFSVKKKACNNNFIHTQNKKSSSCNFGVCFLNFHCGKSLKNESYKSCKPVNYSEVYLTVKFVLKLSLSIAALTELQMNEIYDALIKFIWRKFFLTLTDHRLLALTLRQWNGPTPQVWVQFVVSRHQCLNLQIRLYPGRQCWVQNGNGIIWTKDLSGFCMLRIWYVA